MSSLDKNFSKSSDRSGIYITCGVIAVHCLVIGWALFFSTSLSGNQPKLNSRLTVQTIALNSNPIPRNPIPRNPIPPTRIDPIPLERKTMWPNESTEYQKVEPETTQKPEKIATQTTPPPPAIHPKEKPVVTPVKAKNAVEKANEEFRTKQKEITEKKKREIEAIKHHQTDLKRKIEEAPKKQEHDATKKKDAAKLAEKQRQEKLMSEAQESIAKISQNKHKTPTNKPVSTVPDSPQTLAHLEIDSISGVKGDVPLSSYEMSYRDEIATRLKLLLRLPEYGDVKVDLTLDRTGKVSKVSIVNADSTLNRKYIEKTLPELSFPPFGIHYASATEYTFSITLSNEI